MALGYPLPTRRGCEFTAGVSFDQEHESYFASGIYATDGPAFTARASAEKDNLLASERHKINGVLCEQVFALLVAQVEAHNAAVEPWPT